MKYRTRTYCTESQKALTWERWNEGSTHIAVFRLDDDSVLAATLGDASTIKPGHLAVAVGRSAQGDLTASQGIVNRTSGFCETWLGGQVDRLIRLDGGIYL